MGVYFVAGVPFSDELYHHGIKGQKWYVRRFQNPDGSLTAEGAKRYAKMIGSKVANAAKSGFQKTKEYIHKKRIINHPERMTDEELSKYIERAKIEQSYNEMMAASRMARKKGRIDSTAILQKFGDNFAKGFGEKFGEKTGNLIGDKLINKSKEKHKTETERLKEQTEELKARRNLREAEDKERAYERQRIQRQLDEDRADRTNQVGDIRLRNTNLRERREQRNNIRRVRDTERELNRQNRIDVRSEARQIRNSRRAARRARRSSGGSSSGSPGTP